ncbi:MAG: superoxide dismutase [Planctomycetota bacterium]
MGFEQAPLPYAYNALEPHIDARTMEIHYSKHHATYVAKLNAALEHQPGLQGKTLEQILGNLDAVPESIRTAVRNNGGGHWNHTLFWQLMSPEGGGEATGEVGEAIKKSFNSFAEFKTKFSDAAVNRFGSGWAWLVAGKDGSLTITSSPNQDTPIMEGKHPILGLDVWEHAYYLLYQNRRPDYIGAWWNVVNWKKVNELYASRK